MKKIFLFFLISFLFLQNYICIADYHYSPELDFEISEQLKDSNINIIKENLPQYSIDLLNEAKINDIFAIRNLNIPRVLCIILKYLKNKIISPIKFLLPVITLLIIFSIFTSFCDTNQEIFKFIVSCFCCIAMSYPIMIVIKNLAFSLKLASKFVLCFIPVFMSFAVASGSPLAAVSFNSTVLYCNQVIIEFIQNLLLPISNTMAGLCIISSLSQKIKLDKMFKIFDCLLKWFLMAFAIIVSLIFSIQKIVGTSVDSILSKKVNFFSGLVPIVGSSLSDALSIVRSSAKIIESNLGAFGILSIFFIFLPPILECYSWNIFLQIGGFLSQMFEFENISVLFSSFRKILNISLAITAIFAFIFIFTTSAIMKIEF